MNHFVVLDGFKGNRAYLNDPARGKMAVIGSTSYMWKILRLPMTFFSQRQAGDIQNRLALNASIARTLVDTLAPLVINTVMAVFYLAVMLNQNVPLTCIGLGALVINVAVSRYVSSQRVNITRVMMRDQAKLAATKASGITMIETIKTTRPISTCRRCASKSAR